MTEHGVATARFDFHYMDAGRRSPDTEPSLRAAWNEAFTGVRAMASALPLLVGGSRSEAGSPRCAWPTGWTPPGWCSWATRSTRRAGPTDCRRAPPVPVPMLFLQGTRDPFAKPDLIATVVGQLGELTMLVPIEGGDHSFNVRGLKADPREVGAGLAEHAGPFVRRVAGPEVPRKHRRRPEEPLGPLRRPRGEAPMWALVPWAEVRRVSNEKPYRRPGVSWRSGRWSGTSSSSRTTGPSAGTVIEGCWRVELNSRAARGGADEIARTRAAYRASSAITPRWMRRPVRRRPGRGRGPVASCGEEPHRVLRVDEVRVELRRPLEAARLLEHRAVAPASSAAALSAR